MNLTFGTPIPPSSRNTNGEQFRAAGQLPCGGLVQRTSPWRPSAPGALHFAFPQGATQIPFAAVFLCAALGGLVLSCSFLKPAESTARHFVLTPFPGGAPAPTMPVSISVGVGQVKLPAYLFNTSLALRKGPNEIEYLPAAIWAERLDAGFQRVLAADLALVLPTDRIHLSAWQKDHVSAELYVTVEQFDVDTAGRGVLVAHWRLLSPGGEQILRTGTSRLSRQGTSPDVEASAAIGTLSELLADFSRQIADALRQSGLTPRNATLQHPRLRLRERRFTGFALQCGSLRRMDTYTPSPAAPSSLCQASHTAPALSSAAEG